MPNQNKSRIQENQRRPRPSDERAMKSSASHSRSSKGAASGSNAQRGNAQREESGARLVLEDAKEQVEQLAHQATDMATNAAKTTAQAVTRATRATGEAIGKTSEAALEMARANPVPLALTGLGVICAGIGLSWLIASNVSGGARKRQTASDGERREGISNGVETVKALASDASAKVSNLAQRTGAQAMQLEQRFEAMIQEHPIVAGATLLAVGAALGFAVPRTALEDSWIGQERDRLMKSARNLVEGVMDKGKALAEHVLPDSTTSDAHA